MATLRPAANPLGPVPSSLNWSKIEAELASFPDQELVAALRDGADLGYNGPQVTVLNDNHASALRAAAQLDKQLAEELRRGWVTGGTDTWQELGFPFLRTSPRGAVPKRNSEKLREIDDATFALGINTYIEGLPQMRFTTVDLVCKEVIRLQEETGEDILISKVDCAAAYRQFPVRRQDWWLLGFTWRQRFYHHRRLSFGCRSSGAWFARLSTAVAWAVAPLLPPGASVVAYLDDFIILAAASVAAAAQQVLLALLQRWGIEVNLKKLQQEGTPRAVQTVLGIEVDTRTMQLRLDAERLQELHLELDSWTGRNSCTKRELQSLIGVLGFAARCVRPGRLHLRRMLQSLKHWGPADTGGQRRPLAGDFFADLQWWRRSLSGWNGVSAFPSTHPSRAPDVVFSSDAASTVGFGAVLGNLYVHGLWGAAEREGGHTWIGYQELAAVTMACGAFGEALRGKRVLVQCDNLADVAMINKLAASTPVYNHLLRQLHELSVDLGFELRAEHLAGALNVLADALSRGRLQEFLELTPVPLHQLRAVQVPAHIRGCLLSALKLR
jgi:hypothetical protein